MPSSSSYSSTFQTATGYEEGQADMTAALPQERTHRRDLNEDLLMEEGDYCRDYVETYGETVKDHFKKEYMERRFNIHRRPNLLRKGMLFLLFLLEVVIVLHFVFLVVFAAGNNSALSQVGSHHTDFGSDASQADMNEFAFVIDQHAIYYAFCFTFLMPQASLFRVVLNAVCHVHNMSIWVLAIRVLALIVFVIAFKDNLTAYSSDARDFRIHWATGVATIAVFLTYMSLTTLAVVCITFPFSLNLKWIGPLLELLTRQDLHEILLYSLNMLALVSMTTGFYSNQFYSLKNYLPYTDGEFKRRKEQENCLLSAFLATLFLALTLVEFKRHEALNHRHYLTKDQFKERFLQFKHLYNAEGETRKKVKVTRVTSTIRIV